MRKHMRAARGTLRPLLSDRDYRAGTPGLPRAPVGLFLRTVSPSADTALAACGVSLSPSG
jgi:hypothetical protein